MTYPTLVAHQDVASLAGATIDTKERWLAHLLPGEGISEIRTGSVAHASVAPQRLDPDSIAMEAGGALEGEVASQGLGDSQAYAAMPARFSTEVTTGPRPQTVNREIKGNRVVSTSHVRPPQGFSAGRVIDRHSLFAPAKADDRIELAFLPAKPVTKALQVASAFHMKKPDAPIFTPAEDLPTMVASLVEESSAHVLAYSPEPKVQVSPFAQVLGLAPETPISLIPRLNQGDHKWAADPLPKSSYSAREQHCLAAGIYFEARGEPVRGQAAVSQVILNRVRNPHFPNTICGVVYQNKHWRNRCQFSFACDRIKDKVRDRKRWEIAEYVARETTEGRIWLKEVGSSTHYHATYVNPRWAGKMKRVGRIGLHIFYRTFKGGWS